MYSMHHFISVISKCPKRQQVMFSNRSFTAFSVLVGSTVRMPNCSAKGPRFNFPNGNNLFFDFHNHHSSSMSLVPVIGKNFSYRATFSTLTAWACGRSLMVSILGS